MRPFIFKLSVALFALLFFSCVSVREQEALSRQIAGSGMKSAEQLAAFFLSRNVKADKSEILDFSKMYIEEAKTEGINSDVAFVQMCLETNFLRFGNLVSPEMHNYCGLGAIDSEHRGERFSTPREGIRAHIQHLHAYGTDAGVPLKGQLIDNRYKWVNPRGKAKTIFGLAGTWAADKQYGQKLDSLLTELEAF